MQKSRWHTSLGRWLAVDKRPDRWLAVVLALVLAVVGLPLMAQSDPPGWSDPLFWLVMGVGFLAQIIDGALGMAFGVTSSSLLLGLGVPPASTSASVHLAELFTTAASGVSHWRVGNVNRRLLLRLALPGALGGFCGAWLLGAGLPGEVLKPWIAGYLILMGLLLVYKALRPSQEVRPIRRVVPLALVGGLLDTLGGGGWGPIVASRLLGRNVAPRLVLGTVNLAEFFVTVVASAVFGYLLQFEHLSYVLALVLGGVLAAPLGALVAKRLPTRLLLGLVGALIVGLSCWTLLTALCLL